MNPEDEITTFHPTKEFYLANPRSIAIRTLCIDTIKILRSLMSLPLVSNDERGNLYAQLEAMNGKFIEMGIKANMQTHLPHDIYRTSPVITSEFAAGQLMTVLGKRVVTEREYDIIAKEFSVEDTKGDKRLIKGKKVPDRLLGFAVVSMVADKVADDLDIKPEELDNLGTDDIGKTSS